MSQKLVKATNGELSPDLSAKIKKLKEEARAKRNNKKSVKDETYGLRPDELELPTLADDPQGMAFNDEEIKALEVTDNEAAKALAFATAIPEKAALLKAKE